MALFNYASKEITIKIVYYGPGLSGKTTNLQYLHANFDPSKRGKLISLATEADRTLFFDFLPVELGKISDFSIRFQLYTVPGQVRYNATRKLVLKGADAVVFVADSQNEMRDQNLESLRNMRENLISNNINPDDIPIMLQFNKRDLSNIASVEELNRDLNEQGKFEFREAVAVTGIGVEDTYQRITQLVLKGIAEKHKITIQPPDELVEAVVDDTSSAGKSSATLFGFESSRFDSVATPGDDPIYATNGAVKAPYQTVVRGESLISTERFDRDLAELKELKSLTKEKMDSMGTSVHELSQICKDLKNMVHNLQAEVKDLKKDQKETQARIKDVNLTINNIKTKKRWFTFL